MANLKIGRMVLGICQTNCYFVYREGCVDVIFIDPADSGDYIYESLKEKGFQVKGILLTHGHFDHIWGSERLRELSGAKIYAYKEEKALCEDSVKNVSEQAGRAYTVVPDEYLEDGARITIAGMTCRLIATPGHTIGGCCYYFEEDRMLISGDTLFQESVGRTDLPTGSMSTLTRSIKERLYVLPDEVKVYPGHGEPTEIGWEKKYNAFCQ
ncbi:glyoxylase-like metal-dependent hydrolase (beta-lactamase superfamily II) [Kineothrix alysoides]|uniref:Glyoxylase-like metal-dependent hydrolase (Beta-lactamase superfamily II) n=1 Tax=Kineothrix alysoides TaxID=1469948 RepID=A0A4R1QX51_9FIRM|nr:MBL fold metallo-hydrolase [Kineothrix alysoides]TCL56014.1 glyoxylase-like metal-dependent hydrolase (beta-lactamase superfamily II) [Kineothrix alysoides]